MRKIIFRGKLTTTGEWAEGFLVDEKHIGNRMQSYPVVPETVGQFTGLHDKNGKGVFEGDIVNVGEDVCCCYWDDGNFEFGLSNEQESIGLAYIPSWCIEVIGNIYDNPELLEVNVR